MNYPYNTIVVVDDNTAILTALKICLAAEFEHVVTLTSPDTLVATLANEQNVDAVLLDMNFSLGVNTGQDGLFWLRTIKKLHPNTPVVLITAYADVQLAVNGLKYGAADFVTKPWDNDNLIGVLRDAIDSNREVVPLDQMEQAALDIDVRGMRVSAKYLIERQRYEGSVKLVGVPFFDGDGVRHLYSINNTDTPLIARWLLGRHPDLDIETRKSVYGDKEAAQEARGD